MEVDADDQAEERPPRSVDRGRCGTATGAWLRCIEEALGLPQEGARAFAGVMARIRREEHGGERSFRYRRVDQSVDIPPQGTGGRTCDKLATRLATSASGRKERKSESTLFVFHSGQEKGGEKDAGRRSGKDGKQAVKPPVPVNPCNKRN